MESEKVTPARTLAQRILAIMAELPYVQRKKRVEFGSTKYAALAYEDLAAEVQPLLVKHGVLIVPSLLGSPKLDMFEQNGKQHMAAAVKMQFTVMNADDAADRLDFVMPGIGYDSSDKAVGKATTYAQKEALRKLFVVPSGEDSEDDHIERLGGKRGPPAQAAGQPQVKPPPAPSQKAHDAAVNRALLQSVSGLGHHEWAALSTDELIKRGEATKEQLSYLWRLLTTKHPSFKAKDFREWIVREMGEDKKWVEEMWQIGAKLAGECISKLAPNG